MSELIIVDTSPVNLPPKPYIDPEAFAQADTRSEIEKLRAIADAAVALFACPSTVLGRFSRTTYGDPNDQRVAALRKELDAAGYSWEEYT